MSDYISHDHEHDGIDRRGFLKCMAWAGTGVLWTISGGVLVSKTLAEVAKAGSSLPTATDLSFLQISDSHIGFNKDGEQGCYRDIQNCSRSHQRDAYPAVFPYSHRRYHAIIEAGGVRHVRSRSSRAAEPKTFSMFLGSMMCSMMEEDCTVNGT